MNRLAVQSLKRKLAADDAAYGLWVTLESPSITEMAVALGLDWVVLDAEHGHLDWNDLVNHLRAGVRSETVILIRVAELNAALIKRALDIGADGVVIPWVETPEQVAQAVRFARYPPAGLRGIGAERATCWGQCFPAHVEQAGQDLLVVPIIETVAAGRHAAQLAAVEGADLFFVGPADYSATAGFAGQWEGPGVAEQILAAKDAIRAAGKYCGIIATDHANLQQRREQGFHMLGVGLDGALLIRGLRAALATVGRDALLRPEFTPERLPAPAAPLPRPPDSMRPDRREAMCPIGSGKIITIAPGVSFEALVGGHNGARNLTTGIVTFAPGATLPCHRHTFSESVTLLAGRAILEAEGRGYSLDPLDNVTLPAGVAHQVSNRSNTDSASFHIAMASAAPSRELVDRFFSRRAMPSDATGWPGAERVTRYAHAQWYSPGPNARFIDFFNADLMPGLEMSGGYGEFAQGGRLPAHLHDFDESICIVEGEATCIVEGRRYALSGRATALQPRGRIHYFINESPRRMAMIWVYAGPQPVRLVVDEKCATVEGNPWKDGEVT